MTEEVKSKKQISLEDCDFSEKAPLVSSPRSLESISKNGLNIKDLYKISIKTYRERFQESKFLPQHLLQERYDHYEDNRKKFIEECKNTRSQMIEKEKEKKKNNNDDDIVEIRNMSQTHNSKPMFTEKIDINDENFSTALKLEKERVERIRKREEVNLRILINCEYDTEINRMKNEKKIEEEKRKEKLEFEEKLKRDRDVVKQNLERDKLKKEKYREKILKEDEDKKERQDKINEKMNKIANHLIKIKEESKSKYENVKEERERKNKEANRKKEEKIQQKIKDYDNKQNKMKELKKIQEEKKKKRNRRT